MSPDAQPIITSPQNPRVKAVVRLRKRSVRDELGLLVVEGCRELTRALDSEWLPAALYYCPTLSAGTGLVERAGALGAELLECSEGVFAKLAYREGSDGLLAVGPQIRADLEGLQHGTVPLLMAAEAIEKPGNLGTLLRSADAAGADGVIVCDGRTDINNPNVVRASLGTLFSVPVVEADSQSTTAWLAGQGIRIVAATPDATMGYTSPDYRGPTCFVVGAEQAGLSSVWLDAADHQVRIPMHGQADSLNVATAATLLLYEAVRQRSEVR